MIREYIAESLVLFKRRPLRSGLSLAGIYIGILTVVAILAIHAGARHEVDELSRLAGFQIFVVCPTIDPQSHQVGELGMSQLKALQWSVALKSAMPRLFIEKEIRGPRETVQAAVFGVDEHFGAIYRLPVEAGRFFLPQEISRKSFVCVLTDKGRDKLFRLQSPIGAIVSIGGEPHRVIGVVPWTDALSRRAFLGGTPDVFVPIPDLLTHMENPHFAIVEVRADLLMNPRLVQSSIEDVLSHHDPQRRSLYSVQAYDYYAQGGRQELEKMLFHLMSIAIISLVVGAIGIGNVMLISVTERIKEIGIRKALGARRGDILGQFLVEAGVLAGGGGLLAVLTGAVALTVCPWFAAGPLNARLPWPVALGCLILSVVVGLLAGAYPASHAALLSPAEAFRSE